MDRPRPGLRRRPAPVRRGGAGRSPSSPPTWSSSWGRWSTRGGRCRWPRPCSSSPSPGVPDLYQGTEVWDLSLVDPDNRRPVDYGARRSLLEKVRGLAADDVRALADEGAAKLWTVWRALAVRREHPEAFGAGRRSYEPLVADRRAGRPRGRLRAGRTGGDGRPPPGPGPGPGRRVGRHHRRAAPRAVDRRAGGERGRRRRRGGPVSVPVGELLARFPVALAGPPMIVGVGAPGRAGRPGGRRRSGGWRWTGPTSGAGSGRRRSIGGRRVATGSRSTADRPVPIPGRRGSRTASTACPGRSTTPPSRGPTAAGGAGPSTARR